MPPVNLRVRDHRAFGRKPTVGMHVIKSLEKYIVGATPTPSYVPGAVSADQVALDGKRLLPCTNYLYSDAAILQHDLIVPCMLS